jgi:hypothetical protein
MRQSSGFRDSQRAAPGRQRPTDYARVIPGWVLGASLVVSCTGTIDAGGPEGASGDPWGWPAQPAGTAGGKGSADSIGVSGPRRLSQSEYANTIEYVMQAPLPAAELGQYIGDGGGSASEESTTFGNDYLRQTPSFALVSSAEALAARASTLLLGDQARRDRVIGCVPASVLDRNCMRKFVTSFGRRALRRPLEPDEITFFVERGLEEAGEVGSSFYAGVDLVIRAMLQSLEFLYRVEFGRDAGRGPGIVKLTSHEVATRMAYFLWGRPPQDTPELPLAAIADQGRLTTRDQVLGVARAMLKSNWYRGPGGQVHRFHELWMGYSHIEGGDRAETTSLVQRVVLDSNGSRPWLDLFRSTETCISKDLAVRYGMQASAAGSQPCSFVNYPAGSKRQGILSHAAILSASMGGHPFGENSQIFRGKYIQNTFLCRYIAPPPPGSVTVKPGKPPMSGRNCKAERAKAGQMAEGTICNGCHQLMDPIGFGLDNYDDAGVFRPYETDEDDKDITLCPASGDGVVPSTGDVQGGAFNGPAGLANLLLQDDVLDGCASTQLFRFGMGRLENREENDSSLLESMTRAFRDGQHQFEALLLSLVTSEGFNFRRIETN